MNPINFIASQRLMIKIILTVFALIALSVVVSNLKAQQSVVLPDKTEMAKDTLFPDSIPTPDWPVDVPDSNPFVRIDVPSLLIWENFLYHILLVGLAWLSYLFPGLKKKNIKMRTAVIGVILIAVFVGLKFFSTQTFSLGMIMSYLINYLLTTKAYDKLYSELIGKSPNPNPAI